MSVWQGQGRDNVTLLLSFRGVRDRRKNLSLVISEEVIYWATREQFPGEGGEWSPSESMVHAGSKYLVGRSISTIF